MLSASERRHRERVHAPEMMLTGPAKRANYEAGRRLYREVHPHIVIADHGTKVISIRSPCT